MAGCGLSYIAGVLRRPYAVRTVFLSERKRCLNYLRRVRFRDGLRCIYCGSSEVKKDGKDRNRY